PRRGGPARRRAGGPTGRRRPPPPGAAPGSPRGVAGSPPGRRGNGAGGGPSWKRRGPREGVTTTPGFPAPLLGGMTHTRGEGTPPPAPCRGPPARPGSWGPREQPALALYLGEVSNTSPPPPGLARRLRPPEGPPRDRPGAAIRRADGGIVRGADRIGTGRPGA